MFPSILIPTFLLTAAMVDGLYTPRSRVLHARHAAILHARASLPDPVVAADPLPIQLVQPSPLRVKAKRQSKKCKPRPTSISPSSSAAPANSAVPANVAQAPSQVDTPNTAPPATQAHHDPPPSTTTTHHTTVAQPSPKPAATTHDTPAPTTSSPPASSGGGGGGGNLPFNGQFHPNGVSGGDGTFYTPGLGACGWTNNDSDDIVAVPFGLWNTVPGWNGANPNNNPICGKKINISFQGKTVTAEIVDECMGCDILGSVDMSPHLFNQLANPSVGRIHNLSWKWA